VKQNNRRKINIKSWLGIDYKKFDGIIPEKIHEELYQSVIRPQEENKPNVIFGDCLFCHYSAESTRGYMDSLDILRTYSDISEIYLKNL
jgi:hypothetical protein